MAVFVRDPPFLGIRARDMLQSSPGATLSYFLAALHCSLPAVCMVTAGYGSFGLLA